MVARLMGAWLMVARLMGALAGATRGARLLARRCGLPVRAVAVALFAAAPPGVPAADAAGAAGPLLPGLYDVTGVAADDVLNIRAEPTASAAIIGHLAHDATGVEAVAERDGWLQVNSGERAGWVSGRYMVAQGGIWPEAGLPAGLSCLGTEPFWKLTPDPAAGWVRLSSLGNDDQSWPIEAILASGARQDLRRAIIAGEMTAVVTPAACSDGMSDRAYGLAAVLVLGRGGKAQMLDGCCLLSTR